MMRSDATEAALGLLGLNGNIDFRTTTTIPLKRKSSTSFSLPPPHDEPSNSTSSDSISCICGFTYDDGFSVACDVCSRWVHAACFDIVSGEVPEEWRCWICEPRRVDTEKAVRLQKMRQKQMLELEGERHKRRVSSPGVDRKRRVASAIDGSSNAKRKRRYSVNNPQQHQQVQQTNGEEEHIDIDEPSTHSYVHIDKDIIPHQHTRDKLKRLAQHWRGITALNSPDDFVTTPVMLAPDDFAIPQQTSLHPLPKSSYSHPTLSSNINPSVRPPSYTVRTTQPIPSSALIAPYTSTIIPSTVYLSDPLNSYAHLGMPKPFVHLIGPPLDVALDARLSGNGSRFVRSGCRPNAVLRPVLCRLPHTAGGSSPDETLTFGVFALRDLKAQEEVVLGWEWDDGSVIHHLPALIDSPHMFAPSRFEHFRHQMTSMLHALSSTFTTCACGAAARDCALTRLAEFVDGQIPPTPSPSPPFLHFEDGPRKTGNREGATDGEKSSSSSTVNLGPLVGIERGFRTRERVPFSGGMSGVEMVRPEMNGFSSWGEVQLAEAGPSRTGSVSARKTERSILIGKDRDKKGKARATEADMEADYASENGHVRLLSGSRRLRRKASLKPPSPSASRRSRSPVSVHTANVDLVPENEDQLPPKLRKKWIHKSSDVLMESHSLRHRPQSPDGEWRAHVRPPEDSVVDDKHENMDVDTPITDLHSSDKRCDPPPVPIVPDEVMMPPPPVPSSATPSLSPPVLSSAIPSQPDRLSSPRTISDSVSPSASFANLSLLSPHINGPAPHFPGSFFRTPADGSPLSSPKQTNTMFLVAKTNSPTVSVSVSEVSEKETSILGSPFARRELVESPETTDTGLSPEAEDPHSSVTDMSPTMSEPAENNMVDSRSISSGADLLSHPHAAPELPSPSLDNRTGPETSLHVDGTLPEDGAPPQAPALASADISAVADVPTHSNSLANSTPQTDSAGLNDGVSVAKEAPMLSDMPMDVGDSCGSVDTLFRSPSPLVQAPPTKVKLSLKDFAMRKKKKREEEMVKTLSSPAVTLAPLQEEATHLDPSKEGAEMHQSPAPTMEEDVKVNHQTPADDVKEKHEEPTLVEDTPPPGEGHQTIPDVQAVETVETGAELKLPPRPEDVRTDPTASLAAKVEIVEASVPSVPEVVSEYSPQSPSPSPSSVSLSPIPLPPSSANKKENSEPFNKAVTRPPVTSHFHNPVTRQVSQEDGEILSPPPPKPLPLAPRAHSPPTHPRSFHATLSGSASPARPSHSLPPRRPLQPAPYRSQLQNAPLNSRPLPSGPRALRAANGSSHSSMYPPNRSLGGPHLAPRAPSADRDRDRIDWDRDRGRMGSWSRGRGGGVWGR